MKWNHCTLMWGLGLALLVVAQGAVAQGAYEDLPALKAGDLLPEEMLVGPNHQVWDDVSTDGFLNTYTISSQFGKVTATSTALVPVRIDELNAIAAMDEVKKSDAYKEAAKEAAEGAYEGAKTLVKHPVKTLEGAASGVGRMFKRASENVKHRDESDSEEKTYKEVLGMARAKREIAAEFGVDVYSSNPLLQERLDDLAWTQFAGNMTVRAPLAFVPGGVGVAVTVTQTTTLLNDAIANTPPEDLRIQNRETLAAMGIRQDVADLYMDNEVFTPRQQTLIVAALKDMEKTANRDAFLKLAVHTDSADLADFRQRMALLYAAYNQNVEPIAEFVELGLFVAGRTESDAIVMLVPVDYLVWTRTAAGAFADLDRALAQLDNVDSKLIWLDKASTQAKKEIMTLGWGYKENLEAELLPKSE